MDLSDLESLLAPLSEDEPCGPDLEYDAEFGEMERAAQSTAEKQFGDTIVAAEPPDWKDVKKRAEALLGRTKDMRVVAYLAQATLNLDGVSGFQLALQLLRSYLETYWDSVHPELDHEDDDDPTYRTNTLITFCDENGMLRDLRSAPLVSSRAVGRFSLRDVELAGEADEKPKAEPASDDWGSGGGEESESSPKGPTLAVIEAAFSDVSVEEIQATEEATRLSAEHIVAIEKFVTEQVGVNFAVSLAPAKNVLEEMNRFVVGQLERRGVYADEPETEADAASEEAGADGDVAAAGIGATAVAVQGFNANGKIMSRKDAIKALDAVCDFYEENEPSSPLPLLIRRAQRLASKSFLDILRDLAPDAVSQAEALGGGGSGGSHSSDDAEAEATDSSSTW